MDDARLAAAAQAGDARALEAMAARHEPLAKYVAKRFLRSGREYDDLHQIARLALVKSIRHFDGAFGVRFSTYAVPVISGELKRFLRDDAPVHVARSIRENAARIRALTAEQPDMPLSQVCEALSLRQEDALLAMDSALPVRSLEERATPDGLPLCDTVGHDDTDERVERIALRALLDTLPEMERAVIERRYFLEHTQSRIASDMGMTQVQVSRLEKRILKRLREAAG